MAANLWLKSSKNLSYWAKFINKNHFNKNIDYNKYFLKGEYYC